MSRLSEKIDFIKSIDLFQYIYLNYFSLNIIHKGHGKIIPYKHAVIDLEEKSKICIGENDIHVGMNKLRKSKTETYIRLRSGAKWNAEGGCEISYGSTIEILRDAVIDSEYFTMNSFSTVLAARHIVLGNDVMIARKVTVFDSDFHGIEYEGQAIESSKTVKIGNHVWIGVNSMILKGVTIGDGSIISANTLVTKDVEEGILIGNESQIYVLKENVKWNR